MKTTNKLRALQEICRFAQDGILGKKVESPVKQTFDKGFAMGKIPGKTGHRK